MNNKFLKLFTIFMAIFTLFGIESIAQENTYDKIVMLDGEERIGNVIGISDDEVKFKYKSENLEYSIKSTQINKIQFASGRIQVINNTSNSKNDGNSANGEMQDHHNKVAVLPFSYIGQGGTRDEKMGKKVQSECYNLLLKNASQFQIQDPITTNANMIKHGIREDNIEGFTPGELANILGCEYIVIGTVTLKTEGTYSGGGTYYSQKTSGNKTTGYSAGGSSSKTDYGTDVDLKIYSDQGHNIFSKSHTSVWSSEDAYKVTLQYLIKRCPLYRK
jgi:hypothetical protein